MYRIESIALQDIPVLVDMGCEAHRESQYGHWPADREMIGNLFINSTTQGQIGIKCLRDELIVGFFIGGLSTMGSSMRPIGMEHSFWVMPKHRGGRAAYLLISHFVQWCKAQNIPAFIAAHFAKDNSKTYKLLEKLGLRECGRLYATGI